MAEMSRTVQPLVHARDARREDAPPVDRLTENGVEEAGELLARAMVDDPCFRYVFPDVEERVDSLPFLFDVAVRYGVLFGEVYVTLAPDGSLGGVGIWLPPGAHRATPARSAEAGFLKLEELLEPEALRRYAEFQRHLAVVHERDVPLEHWYLTLVGVEPMLQRRGLGSALLWPVLAHADAAEVPCYLETFSGANVSFYARRGFFVITEGEEPTSGLPFWTMRRDPITAL